MLDDTVKTPEDVETYLGLNVLASIPVYDGANVKEQKTCKRALGPEFPEKNCEKVRFGRSEDERNIIEFKEHAGLQN